MVAVVWPAAVVCRQLLNFQEEIPVQQLNTGLGDFFRHKYAVCTSVSGAQSGL